MADVINLRRARKQAQRVEADSAAAKNRVAFGRSKASRKLAEADEARAAAAHAGHFRIHAAKPKPDAQN